MRASLPRPPLSFLMWFGLLGAPLAWTVQHVVGMGLALAACTERMRPEGVPVDPWTIVATASAATITVLAGLAALAAFRATSGGDDEPPGARIHFLATVGIVVTPLFLAIILMSGTTAVLFPTCQQA